MKGENNDRSATGYLRLNHVPRLLPPVASRTHSTGYCGGTIPRWSESRLISGTQMEEKNLASRRLFANGNALIEPPTVWRCGAEASNGVVIASAPVFVPMR